MSFPIRATVDRRWCTWWESNGFNGGSPSFSIWIQTLELPLVINCVNGKSPINKGDFPSYKPPLTWDFLYFPRFFSMNFPIKKNFRFQPRKTTSFPGPTLRWGGRIVYTGMCWRWMSATMANQPWLMVPKLPKIFKSLQLWPEFFYSFLNTRKAHL